MTHTPTAPLSDLPRIIRDNLEICREYDEANATLVLSREMLEELDGLLGMSQCPAMPDYRCALEPMEWQSAVGDGRMNNDWQLYVDGSLRRYIENRLHILEQRIAELEKKP